MHYQKITAALLCAATFPSFAAEILPEVVITAARVEQSAAQNLASTSVITRADIERLQAQSLTDVFRGVAGLTISNSGGAGKKTYIYLRGTNADHVLVLVDGIKIGSATDGYASFQDIPVAQIERIEIVRGPRASLYGSEAIGGVIQIFTRKNAGTSASFSAGSYDTFLSRLGVGVGDANGWVNLLAQQQNVRGFNSCRGNTTAGCYVIQPDKDGYHARSLGLKAGYVADNGLRAELNALQALSQNQYDGSAYAGNQADGLQQVLGGSLTFAPLTDWHVTVRLGSSQDHSTAFNNGIFFSRFNTQRDSLTLQNVFALRDNQLLTVGFDQQKDSVDSDTVFAQTSRNNDAFFTQYQGSSGAHRLQLSTRRDNNQQYGGHSTSSIGYGYELNERTRFAASYGTAFKAPTFNQLYYPNYGSATLHPELSSSAELDLTQTTDWGLWSFSVYQTDLTDLIVDDSHYTPVNIATARLTGLEAELKTQLAEWEINTTVTLQDPRQTSGANSGKLLSRRATASARIELAHQFGDLRMASSLYAEGRRYDDLANTADSQLAGYGLVELRADYRLSATWRVQGRIDNLTDKQYETAQYYNQAGRGFYLTLSYQAQ